MISKKTVILMLLAAALFAALPFAAEGLRGGRDIPLLEQARDYISAENGVEFMAHFSAFTGLAYWLFSNTLDVFWEFDDGGLGDFLYDLFRDGLRDYKFKRDTPGTFSI